ncbi:MAG: mannonate dehydratase [Bryobacterales bacterium]|nr:mannonate dehydratase [Bryobacterales bacterium]
MLSGGGRAPWTVESLTKQMDPGSRRHHCRQPRRSASRATSSTANPATSATRTSKTSSNPSSPPARWACPSSSTTSTPTAPWKATSRRSTRSVASPAGPASTSNSSSLPTSATPAVRKNSARSSKTFPPLPDIGAHLDQMWANITYFLKAVIPTAEKAVRSLHPNDPPAPISRGSQQSWPPRRLEEAHLHRRQPRQRHHLRLRRHPRVGRRPHRRLPLFQARATASTTSTSATSSS